MKNSLLFKGLLTCLLFCCLNKASAQLASDTPARVSDRPLTNAGKDSTTRVLASEAPVLKQNNSKAKTGSQSSQTLILPSEQLIENKNAKTLKKQ